MPASIDGFLPSTLALTERLGDTVNDNGNDDNRRTCLQALTDIKRLNRLQHIFTKPCVYVTWHSDDIALTP